MSQFPTVVQLKYGEEKESHSAKVFELGTRGTLPDGREFAFAHCSSTAALNIGQMCVQKALGHTAQVVSWTGSAAVGATTVIVTTSATGAVTANQYQDGYLWVFSDNGQGYTHKVKANNSAAVSSTCTFTLYPYDPVKVLIKAASSKIGLRENEFADVLTRGAATEQVGLLAGVPANSVAADQYFWVQRKGPVAVFASDTVGLMGEPAACGSAEAGLTRYLIDADTTTIGHWEVARFMAAPAASADYVLVYLELDKSR